MRGGRANMKAIAELKARGDIQHCWSCGKELWADAPHHHPRHITLGHYIALEDGGALWDPENYGPQCGKCNYGDGARRTNAKRRARHRAAGTTYISPNW